MIFDGKIRGRRNISKNDEPFINVEKVTDCLCGTICFRLVGLYNSKLNDPSIF